MATILGILYWLGIIGYIAWEQHHFHRNEHKWQQYKDDDNDDDNWDNPYETRI